MQMYYFFCPNCGYKFKIYKCAIYGNHTGYCGECQTICKLYKDVNVWIVKDKHKKSIECELEYYNTEHERDIGRFKYYTIIV